MILNVYMPYVCTENKDLYLEYLGRLGAILHDAVTSTTMVLGDFKAGFNYNTYFEKYLLDFCADNQLTISEYRFLPEESFTYISDANSTTSWL